MDEKDYNKENKERIERIKEYAVKIGMAFLSAVGELLKLIKGFPLPEEGVMFSFDALPLAKREEAERRLRHLHSVAKAITEDGMRAEWLKSDEFNDELVESMTGIVRGNPELAGWFERNNQARNAFIRRKVNGLNLSDRIWKTVRQLREELEIAVTVSMGEGESAASMSRKVKNYLNDPDLMFRRFRYKAGEDKEGNPIYRKKWKKRVMDEATGRYKFVDYDKDSYKVGRGYYKSSTMNAMRVTRTETNMAYRMADHDRWQRLDFVLGQRIKTSKNHKDEDICDELAGDYPKEFVFTGWHPQCMCYCTPIMLEPKEVFRMSRAKLDGKTIKPSRGPVTKYPEGFRKWVSGNSEYISRKRAEGKEPYFVRDNADVVDNILEDNRKNQLNKLGTAKFGRKATKKEIDALANHKELHDYTEAQVENLKDLSKEIGVELKSPMTFEEADRGHSNLSQDRSNCATCVIVHELRLRGLDITAKAHNIKSKAANTISENTKSAWMTAKGKEPEFTAKLKGTDKEIAQKIEKITKPLGSRYHIGWDYSDEGGHIITAVRTKEGLIFYDPQRNEYLSLQEIIQDMDKGTSLEILRVDRLLVRTSLIKDLAESAM